MAFLIVDESKCKKDGICVAECPSGLIKLQEDTGYPGIIPGGDKVCIRCGHCVAVCPNGALILLGYSGRRLPTNQARAYY